MSTSVESLAPDLFAPAVEPSGLVYALAPGCTGQGPGRRTVVYLKGCPLRCVWCPNPEGQAFRPEVLLFDERCSRCGRCSQVCDRGRHIITSAQHLLHGSHLCDGCQDCAETCPFEALQAVGRVRTVSEIIDLVALNGELGDGGVTLAGGEPLFQDEFTLALLAAIRDRQWHSAVDTNGYAPPLLFADMLGLVDLVLFDLKETNSDLHTAWTGVPLEPILDNLELAGDSGVELWLRCPVVPLLNDRNDHWERVAALALSLPSRPPVHLMPHQPGGERKRTGLGRSALNLDGLEAPSPDRLEEIAELLAAYGVEVHAPVC